MKALLVASYGVAITRNVTYKLYKNNVVITLYVCISLN